MSPIRYQVGPRGRHRKPRQPRTNALIRGGLLSGVVGTVAVTGTTPATADQSGAVETTAHRPVFDGVLTDSAHRASQATVTYVGEAEAQQEREQALEQAITEARDAAAEQREREEREARRVAAAAAAEARRQAAEEAEAEEAAAAEAQSLATEEAPSGTGAAAVVDYVRSQLGDYYVSGGTGPDSWDCSGLTQAAFSNVGVSLPRTAAEQSLAGTQVSLDAIQPGDILYWGGAGSAYHVAVYIGDGAFIGAQNSSTGVVERTLDWDPPTGAIRLL